MLDLAIRGGTLVDGTGAPRRRADVGVRDRRIVSVGTDLGPAEREVDATGRIVAPGFIDSHTHYDPQVLWDPYCSPAPLHGVTTVIAGNCGFTLAPNPADDESIAWILGLFATAEQLPIATLREGVRFRWRSFAEFLDVVQERLAINIGFLAGHAALRRTVMGARASFDPATDEEIRAMCDLLRVSISEGALGLSTSHSAFQFDAAGLPSPPRMATREEMLALARVCGEFKGTRVQHTPLKGPGGRVDPGTRQLVLDMAVGANRPTFWQAVVLNSNDPEQHERALSIADDARALGAEVLAQFSAAQGATPGVARFDLVRGNWLPALPGMDEWRKLDVRGRLRAFGDPEFRRRFRNSFEQGESPVLQFLRRDLGTLEINDVPNESMKPLIGRRLSDVAAERDVDMFDAMIDISVEGELEVGFVPDATRLDEHEWNEAAVRRVLTDRRVVWAATDSGAHVATLVGCDFGPKCLARFVRDERVLTLEQAIHQLTGRVAWAWGLEHRGRVTVGSFADLVVLDPDRIDVDGRVRPVHDLPSDGMRLYNAAIGIDRVFVNGTEVVHDGHLTDAMAGQVLRSGIDASRSHLYD